MTMRGWWLIAVTLLWLAFAVLMMVNTSRAGETPVAAPAPLSSLSEPPPATPTFSITETVVATPDPAPAPSSAAQRPIIYTVVPGDTLDSLAFSFYGDVRFAYELGIANNMADPNHLRVGQQLVIP